MENATKALLMAAGILIAIIILSLAIAVYGRISGFYQTKQRNISEEQLAAFNTEYSVYDRDDVSGFELVSLINKAIDFNQNKVYGASNTKEGNEGEQLGDGFEEMSIKVIIPSTAQYNGKLFEANKTIIYDGKNSGKRNNLAGKITKMQNLEKLKYKPMGASELTKLVSNKYYLKEYIGENEWNKLADSSKKTIKGVLGKEYNNLPTLDELEQYEDYLTFKRANFMCRSKDTVYKNGQIVEMTFEQK